jgi:dTDP-4-dehydrorhamnose reductase
MAGLVPAIHVFLCLRFQDVDARHAAGPDGSATARMTRYDALVIGGDGLVGGELTLALRASGYAVRATSRRATADALALDLADPDLSALGRERFACAFICAGVTNMQACESAPDAARRVNVENTLKVMRALAQTGAHLVFLSSGQVFDGEVPRPDERALRRPKNRYGRHKLEVEEAIAREGLPAAALRVTKILAKVPVGMFRTWHEALRAGRPAVAATNMTIAPVSAQDVAQTAMRLGFERRAGPWHLSSSDELTYADAALRMAEICGLPPALVRGEEVTEAQVPAIYRHRYAALNSDKLAGALAFPIHPAAAVLTELFSAFPAASTVPTA